VRPILFLDVDGVIGPMLHDRPDTAPKTYPADTWLWERTGPYDLLLSTAMIAELEEILEHVELVWCTTWEHHTQHIEQRLGWEPSRVVSVDRGGVDHVPWKHDAIVAELTRIGVDRRRPFIVLDDHSVHPHNEWLLVDKLAEEQVRGRRLLIAPNSYTGLEPFHFERMRRFLDRVT
jgi:hypothetical protein